MLYEKTLDRKFAEHSDAAAVTLMSSDVENIASGVQNVHEVWASPVEVGIALYLLERQMIWAAAVPAVISFAVVYLTGLISKAAPGRQKLWMQAVRERVAFTSSYLDTSKAIKMLGISGQVSMILQRLRVNELNLQKKFRHLMVKMNLLSGTTSNLSPAITLSLYTGVALHTGRNPLTDAQAFTSLSIISLVSSPLSNLVYSGPKATAALECFQRMQEYLLAKSRDDDRIIDQNLSDGVHSTGPEGYEQELQPMAGNQISKNIQLRCERSPVQLYQADFGWDRNSAATLLNINLSCPGSSLTMIIGTVGSGKSMLLKAILGELPCLKGFIHVQAPEIAFCDSRPWTRHGTLRDNICKPLPYDEGWYQTVIRACALDYDIESLPQRDLTIIGSNGAATSGGQRQRISIARAVYARKKLAVFDDFFSSLDASTSEHVFTRVFGKEGILRRHGVTAILATHTIAFLPFADQVVMLDGGRVLEQGPPERFHVGNSDLLDKVAASLDSIDEPGVVQDKPGTDFMSDEPEKEMERKLGDLSVYGYYLRAAGLGNVFVYFVCLLIGVFCSQFTSKSLPQPGFTCSHGRSLGSVVGRREQADPIRPSQPVHQHLCHIGRFRSCAVGVMYVASLLSHRSHVFEQAPRVSRY